MGREFKQIEVEIPLYSQGVLGDTVVQISEQCTKCVHFLNSKGGFTCNAFPKGIPLEIIRGDIDHLKPFPGDNGIQYEA